MRIVVDFLLILWSLKLGFSADIFVFLIYFLIMFLYKYLCTYDGYERNDRQQLDS